jgi:2-keto-3-deoxy-L-rhamnonate aldolase RhmA
MFKKNKLKESLEEGKLVVGSCVYTNSPILVELAGFCGLDFIRIDNEHSWRRDESAENMMRAAANSGMRAGSSLK